MNEKEKKDLVISKVVLITLGVIGVLVTIYLGWIHPSAKPAVIDSFAECAKAGNPIQESYPEVCVTKDGKRFTNPDQNIQRLTIAEWSVSAMITGVNDAYYTYDATADEAYVTTRALEAALKKVDGCTSGLHGVTYQRVKLGDAKDEGSTWQAADVEGAAQSGDYYYPEKSLIQTLCMPDGTDPNVKLINEIKTKVQTAFKAVQ